MATEKQIAARKKFTEMVKKKNASKTKAAFSEMKKNPPKVLAKTKKKKGAKAAEKQRVAIGLSKARAAGADIPMPPKKMMTREDIRKRMAERAQTA